MLHSADKDKIKKINRTVAIIAGTLTIFYFNTINAAGEFGSRGFMTRESGILEDEGETPHLKLFPHPKSTGAATFSIPLDMPKGRLGIIPAIKLSYNSRKRISWAGYGWSLETGKIVRNGNGKKAPDFDDSKDTFSVKTSGISSPLTKPDGFDYYTTLEKTWIRADKTSDGWIIKDKGKKYEFFYKVGSILNGIYSDSDNRIREWALTAIEDKNGNRIEYTYTPVNQSTGDYYPDKIFYVKNGSYDDKRAVQFVLEDRPDHPSDETKGHVVLTKRIDYIDIWSKWNGSPSSSVLFKRYDFEYDIKFPAPPPGCETCKIRDCCNGCDNSCCNDGEYTYCFKCGDKTSTPYNERKSDWSTGDSRLIRITEMYPDKGGYEPAYSSPAWEFEYSDKIPGWGPEEDDLFPDGENHDFSYHYEDATSSYYRDRGRRIGDVNGDGCIDIIKSTADCGGNVSSYVYLSNCDGTFSDAGITVPVAFTVYAECSKGSYRDLGARLVDINGDGFVDIVVARKDCSENIQEVYLNQNGNGWSDSPDTFWSDNLPNGAYFIKYDCDDGRVKKVLPYGLRFANLNGDQYPDILIYSHINTSYRYVAFNKGDGTWDKKTSGLGYVPRKTSHKAMVIGDVNGDGLDDILYSYIDDKNDDDSSNDYKIKKIYINNASSYWKLDYNLSDDNFPYLFAAKDYDVDNPSINQQDRLDGVAIDINGDHRVDLIDNFRVRINCSHCATSPPNPKETRKWYQTNFMHPCDQINYTGGINGEESGTPWDVGTRYWDGDGDGQPDIYNLNNETPCYAHGKGDEHWPSTSTKENMSPIQNLLTHITAPTGAAFRLYYRPSTQYDNKDENGKSTLPIVVYVLSKVETDDGRDNTTVTEYTYSGGKFSKKDNEFFGFKKVVTKDNAGNTKETVYYQHKILKGKIKSITRKNSAGKIFFKKNFYYTTDYSDTPDCDAGNIDCTTPYFNPLRRIDTYIYDLADSPRYRTSVTSDYKLTTDGFLSEVITTYWGKDDGTLNENYPENAPDQKTIITKYVSNSDPSKWLINLPAKVRTYDGVVSDFDSQWVKESETIYDDGDGKYDGNERWNDIPQAGHVIHIARRGQDGTEISSSITFDTTYNVAKEFTDSSGNTYILNYGSGCDGKTSGPFVSCSISPDGRKLAVYYNTHGRMYKLEDVANGITIESDTDVKHRLKEIKISGDTIITKNYYNEGDPASYYEEIKFLLGDEKYSSLKNYLDGLGRIYRIVRNGISSDKDIIVNKTFDISGELKTVSIPFYRKDGASLKWEFEYDGLGRVTKIFNPENGNRTYAEIKYLGDTNILIDEKGLQKEYHFDAYGKLLSTVENFENKRLETKYIYGPSDFLLKIIDPSGKTRREVEYDGLGRRIKVKDSASGIWRYRYDSDGNLVRQRDPNGNTVKFIYDEIGRLIKAEYWKASGSKPQFIYRYYYDTDSNGTSRGASKGRLVEAKSMRYIRTPDPLRPGSYKWDIETFSNTLFDYDVRGRLKIITKTIEGDTVKTKYEYNNINAITTVINFYEDPDLEEKVIYDYNSAGFLKKVRSITTKDNKETILLSNIELDAEGEVEKFVYGNGIINHFEFDKNFRNMLSRIWSEKSNGEILIDMSFTRDESGKITEIRDEVGHLTKAYLYDDLGRLISGGWESNDDSLVYRYDDLGNLLEIQGPKTVIP